MSYHGDIRLGDTIDIKFTTRRFSTGAPHTLAGSPVISAYVGNGTTEITAGITLTVDFDSRTGLNNVRVVASGGNGFATATNVQLVITTGTVDSISVVGEVIGSFSIENRSPVMPTTAGRTLTIESDGMAHADVKEWGGSTTPVTNLNTVFNTDFAANYNTTNDGWVVKLGDYAHGGTSANTTLGTLTVGGTTSLAAVTTSGTVTLNALTVSNATTLSGAVSLGSTLAVTGTTTLAALTTTGTATLNALTVSNATTLTGAVSLGSTLGVTGAITATNASNNLRLGTFTVDTNAVAWNASWDAEVQSEVDDALIAQRLDELLNADSDIDGAQPPTVGSVFHELMTKTTGSFTFDQTTDSLEAVRDRGDTAWITATTVTLTSGERDSIAAALLDLAAGVETGRTVRQALRLILAAVAGKLSGAATTTVAIRDTNDSKDRITATVDASGNRSAVTLDAT